MNHFQKTTISLAVTFATLGMMAPPSRATIIPCGETDQMSVIIRTEGEATSALPSGNDSGINKVKVGEGADPCSGSDKKTADGNNKGDCQCENPTAAEPFDPQSGMMWHDELDLSVNSGLLPLIVTRRYTHDTQNKTPIRGDLFTKFLRAQSDAHLTPLYAEANTGFTQALSAFNTTSEETGLIGGVFLSLSSGTFSAGCAPCMLCVLPCDDCGDYDLGCWEEQDPPPNCFSTRAEDEVSASLIAFSQEANLNAVGHRAQCLRIASAMAKNHFAELIFANEAPAYPPAFQDRIDSITSHVLNDSEWSTLVYPIYVGGNCTGQAGHPSPIPISQEVFESWVVGAAALQLYSESITLGDFAKYETLDEAFEASFGSSLVPRVPFSGRDMSREWSHNLESIMYPPGSVVSPAAFDTSLVSYYVLQSSENIGLSAGGNLIPVDGTAKAHLLARGKGDGVIIPASLPGAFDAFPAVSGAIPASDATYPRLAVPVEYYPSPNLRMTYGPSLDDQESTTGLQLGLLRRIDLLATDHGTDHTTPLEHVIVESLVIERNPATGTISMVRYGDACDGVTGTTFSGPPDWYRRPQLRYEYDGNTLTAVNLCAGDPSFTPFGPGCDASGFTNPDVLFRVEYDYDTFDGVEYLTAVTKFDVDSSTSALIPRSETTYSYDTSIDGVLYERIESDLRAAESTQVERILWNYDGEGRYASAAKVTSNGGVERERSRTFVRPFYTVGEDTYQEVLIWHEGEDDRPDGGQIFIYDEHHRVLARNDVRTPFTFDSEGELDTQFGASGSVTYYLNDAFDSPLDPSVCPTCDNKDFVVSLDSMAGATGYGTKITASLSRSIKSSTAGYTEFTRLPESRFGGQIAYTLTGTLDYPGTFASKFRDLGKWVHPSFIRSNWTATRAELTSAKYNPSSPESAQGYEAGTASMTKYTFASHGEGTPEQVASPFSSPTQEQLAWYRAMGLDVDELTEDFVDYEDSDNYTGSTPTWRLPFFEPWRGAPRTVTSFTYAPFPQTSGPDKWGWREVTRSHAEFGTSSVPRPWVTKVYGERANGLAPDTVTWEPTGEVEYVRNPSGNPSWQVTGIGIYPIGSGVDLGFVPEYDSLGRMTASKIFDVSSSTWELLYESGTTTYDELGRPTTMSSTYDPEDPNGATTTIDWATHDEPASVATSILSTFDSSEWNADVDLWFDGVGRLIKSADSAGRVSQTEYDEFGAMLRTWSELKMPGSTEVAGRFGVSAERGKHSETTSWGTILDEGTEGPFLSQTLEAFDRREGDLLLDTVVHVDLTTTTLEIAYAGDKITVNRRDGAYIESDPDLTVWGDGSSSADNVPAGRAFESRTHVRPTPFQNGDFFRALLELTDWGAFISRRSEGPLAFLKFDYERDSSDKLSDPRHRIETDEQWLKGTTPDFVGANTYEYDDQDRLSKVTVWADSAKTSALYSQLYVYDDLGRVTRIRHTPGADFHYDSESRDYGARSRLAEYEYNVRNEITKVTYSIIEQADADDAFPTTVYRALRTRYTYDGGGRLRNMINETPTGSLGNWTHLRSYTYTYDAAGWIESILQEGGPQIAWNATTYRATVTRFDSTPGESATTRPGVLRQFTYDTFGRLITEERTWFDGSVSTDTTPVKKRWKFTYDLEGNLISTLASQPYSTTPDNSLYTVPFTPEPEQWHQISGAYYDYDPLGRALRTSFGETGAQTIPEANYPNESPVGRGAMFEHRISHGFTLARWTQNSTYEGGQRRFYDSCSRLLARDTIIGSWTTDVPNEMMQVFEDSPANEVQSGESFAGAVPALEESQGTLLFEGISKEGALLVEPTPAAQLAMLGGGRTPPTLYLEWDDVRRLYYPQLGWNDAAQFRKEGGTRHPDFSLYHAGGLDSLVGAVKWTAHPSVQGDYIATDLFVMRDHLGSIVMTLKADKTCLMWSDPGPGEGDPVCLQSVYSLTPQESYDYAPYGTPTMHVPATDGNVSSEGRLAVKSYTGSTLAATGTKSSYNFLDAGDIGRPNGATGYAWVRTGAVPAAKSVLGWDYTFTGRPWDADVRQYYIRNRWYDPHQSRWTALDPISYRGGLNQYQYCGGNPVCAVDPLGLRTVTILLPDGTSFSYDVEDSQNALDDGPFSIAFRNFKDLRDLYDEASGSNCAKERIKLLFVRDQKVHSSGRQILGEYDPRGGKHQIHVYPAAYDNPATPLPGEPVSESEKNDAWNFIIHESNLWFASVIVHELKHALQYCANGGGATGLAAMGNKQGEDEAFDRQKKFIEQNAFRDSEGRVWPSEALLDFIKEVRER